MFIERFSNVVARHADRPAVVMNGKVALTYRELDAYSDRIAFELQKKVDKNRVVGILLPKSPELIAAMLGTWKAEAAWLALDPSLPNNPCQQRLRDCRAVALISNDSASENLYPETPYLLDLTKLSSTAVPSHRPTPRADDLAYVVYTSGTSGQPRGVEINHSGIMNLLDSQCAAFHISEHSRCLLFYPSFFDAFVSDVGTALISGAALFIESGLNEPGRTSNADWDLGQILRTRGISHADIPPSMLNLLSSEEVPSCLSMLVIGGEACDIETARRWAERLHLVIVYGPTETTVCSSLIECDPIRWNRPLIGQPLKGVRYLIVDADLAPVEVGIAGELLISGSCVARGYVNQPETTAEKFIDIGGSRYYRSGDKVLRDVDGEYVFLGRTDRQIKLNGLRIEPEEIENVLREYSPVREVAVVKRKFSETSPREILVAFVTGSLQLTDVERIKAILSARLPAYKIPTHIRIIDELPRGVSGKPDYQGLTTMQLVDAERLSIDGDSVDLTDQERIVLSIFREALGVSTICLDDDYFESGGDSLGVMQVCLSAASASIPLSPWMIYDGRIFREVCRRLADRLNHGDCSNHSSGLESAIPYRADCDRLRQDVQSLADAIPVPKEPLTNANKNRAEHTNQARKILLTGATGFLGSRILAELARNDENGIVCLIRGHDHAQAAQRLWDHMASQQLEITVAARRRIHVLSADLRQPQFGLTQREYKSLANGIDTVIHCAAELHVLQDYSTLRPGNVEAVAEIIRFLSRTENALLYHASSLSVFAGTDRFAGLHYESDGLMPSGFVFGGYAQSKWAAEHLLNQCGLPRHRLQIIRYGLLTGDTRTGLSPPNDILTMTVQGLLKLECVPDPIPEIHCDITPVDLAALATVCIVLQGCSFNNPFHTWQVANAARVSAKTLFQWLERQGTTLEKVSWPEFKKRASALAENDPSIVEENRQRAIVAAPCLSLLRWAGDPQNADAYRPFDLFQATNARFDTTHTSGLLALANHRFHEQTSEETLLQLSLPTSAFAKKVKSEIG